MRDWATQFRVSHEQVYLYPLPVNPRTRHEYRRVARWWSLEAEREYSEASTQSAREYAANMRWMAELAGLHGPGTWSELKARAESASKARPSPSVTAMRGG